jgi:type IV pilus assembly protein PilO
MLREPLWLAAWRVNRKIPLLLLGLLLANVLIYYVPLRMIANQADSIQSDYIRMQAQQRSQSSESGTLTPAETYVRSVEDMQRFRNEIPDQTELSGLVDELFRIAEKSGLKITSVKYDPQRDADQNLLHYDLGFEVDGTYAQVKKMVHAVEQSPRLLAIDKLSLNSSKSDGNVRLRLKLTTFFRTDKV